MHSKKSATLLEPKKLSASQKKFLEFHEKAVKKKAQGSPVDLKTEKKLSTLK